MSCIIGEPGVALHVGRREDTSFLGVLLVDERSDGMETEQ